MRITSKIAWKPVKTWLSASLLKFIFVKIQHFLTHFRQKSTFFRLLLAAKSDEIGSFRHHNIDRCLFLEATGVQNFLINRASDLICAGLPVAHRNRIDPRHRAFRKPDR
jgi:hypothetical protein